jgi:hypothetical protein
MDFVLTLVSFRELLDVVVNCALARGVDNYDLIKLC